MTQAEYDERHALAYRVCRGDVLTFSEAKRLSDLNERLEASTAPPDRLPPEIAALLDDVLKESPK